MKGSLIVIDDDELLLGFLEEILTTDGFSVNAFTSPVDGIKYLDDKSADMVITDVKMNEMTGDEVLAHVMSKHPSTGVIMITGFGNINHAVRALHKGAFDYVTKPFKAKEIISRVNRYFEEDHTDELSRRTTQIKKPEASSSTDSETSNDKVSPIKTAKKGKLTFVGQDPQIQKLLNIVPQIARNNAPVLIQGESGTGKEVFAHEIHVHSDRSDAPYIKINCANLPSELVESTLFGHIKGAFTGAISDRKGAFDAAEGGTLLLDEITEIDINVQAKLLRVLQENEFYRVGSQKPIKADVRIISTSNRNIGEAISEKRFREDLYYRLNVFPVEIPPLRHRKEDIPVLARHFVEQYTQRYQMPDKEISSELLEHLMNQEWRGNVRELSNKIHRGIILAQDSDEMKIEHIENDLFSSVDDELQQSSVNQEDLPLMSIEDMEMQLIRKALDKTNGNQKKAAKLLGISDRTIRNKLKNAEDE